MNAALLFGIQQLDFRSGPQVDGLLAVEYGKELGTNRFSIP